MWLTNCNVVDVESGTVAMNQMVQVKAGIIASIEPSAPLDGSEEMIDLEGKYLCPGLITCHAHLSQIYPLSDALFPESPATSVLRAYSRARDALVAGITTVRCVSEAAGVDLHLRDAIQRGLIEGPRIIAGGRGLSVSGGHGSHFTSAVTADGADGFLAAARQELGTGARHLKIFITGGLASEAEKPSQIQMTVEEIRAVVTAAEEHGAYVIAHAGASAPIMTALSAGVRSFEHGYDLSAEAAEAMAAAGAYLGATLCVSRMPDFMKATGYDDEHIDRCSAAGSLHIESAKNAVRAGVTMVNSTDFPPGGLDNGVSIVVREMEFLVEAGLTPLEALQATTINGARLCKVEDETGTVKVGKAADLIAMVGNPIESVSAMYELSLVVAGGKIIR